MLARLVSDLFIEVFDLLDDGTKGLEHVPTAPVLFTVCTTPAALASGRWLVVGQTAMAEDERPEPSRFVQDRWSPTQCQILGPDGKCRKATIAECVGLERCAAWDALNLEQRISDHFDGVENVAVKYFALEIPEGTEL